MPPAKYHLSIDLTYIYEAKKKKKKSKDYFQSAEAQGYQIYLL